MKLNSADLIGKVRQKFDRAPKSTDYRSYYAGWLDGRTDLISTERKSRIKTAFEIVLLAVLVFTIFFIAFTS